jgi:pyruvate kinase
MLNAPLPNSVKAQYKTMAPGQSIKRSLKHSLQQREEVPFNPVNVRSQIICTVGPATNNVEILSELLKNGMSVARLNFSHGSYEYHASVIQNVRAASKATGHTCAIMLDTKGPEIRTGKYRDGRKEVKFNVGDTYTWVPEEGFLGDDKFGALSWLNIAKHVVPGDRILVGDGLLAFVVLQVLDNGWIESKAENSGVMGENKNVNLPGVVVDLPAVTDKDIKDIEFGIQQEVDFIAASFIRKADDVKEIRALPGIKEAKILIISKIESQEGLDNFDEIVEESDGVMVARGDLGVQIPIKKVATAQKMMITKCNSVGKPVITATQMLESMIQNPRPTRAEATDVANAVFDGSDCVMLSGETAAGKYPVEAVEMMAQICYQAESDIDYRALYRKIRELVIAPPISVPDTIASSSVKSSWDINATAIICLTETGTTARLVSKYRPSCPILCVTPNAYVSRQIQISRGCIPFIVESMKGTDKVIETAIRHAKDELKIVKAGDFVVITSGFLEGTSGATNMFQVRQVPE